MLRYPLLVNLRPMRKIIADIYKIIYGITRLSKLSLFLALSYATAVNFILLQGIFLLVQGWMPTKALLRIFQSPYAVWTIAVLFLIHLRMMMPLTNLTKERKKSIYYMSLLAFTVTPIIVLIYIHYRDQLM